MRKFLIDSGKYKIDSIDYNYQYTEYHNKVVDEVRKIDVVYPIDIPLDIFISDKSYSELTREWSTIAVFNRELKIKLLNL
jgi:hypothetical protein